MANWNLPTITSGYINFVDEMNAKFVDAATLLGTGTNLPVSTKRINLVGVGPSFFFQEWNGTTWLDRHLHVAGGGTGANNPATARINLGIGSMGTQNSNAVNITGGSISGVNYSASDINAGILALARGGTGASLSLGPNGHVLGVSGGQVQFMNGQSITELYAGALVTGTVPLARLSGVGLLASQNDWSGVNIFTGANEGAFWLSAPNPALNLYSSAAVEGSRHLRIINAQGDFLFQTMEPAPVTRFHIANNGILTGNGSGFTNLNAANLATGIVPIGRLGAGGTPNTTTFLRGDNTWQVPPSGGGGSVVDIPTGLIAMFDTACPAGWTRVAALDGRYPMGATTWGNAFGTDRHIHTQNGFTQPGGGIDPIPFTGTGDGRAIGNSGGGTGDLYFQNIVGGSFEVPRPTHFHPIDIPVNVNVSGNTNSVPAHTHQVTHNVNEAEHIPPTLTVVYCRKN